MISGGPEGLVRREDVDSSRNYITFLAAIYARKIIMLISEVKSRGIIPKYVIKTLKSTITDRTPGS